MGGAIRAIIDSFLVDPVLQPNQLGYAEKTLRESRVTGKLAGVTTPAYIKRGHRVIYDEEDLLAWAAQFRKITNTSQSSIDRAS